jgi:hypothetical protein
MVVFLALDTLFLGLKALNYNGFKVFQQALVKVRIGQNTRPGMGLALNPSRMLG